MMSVEFILQMINDSPAATNLCVYRNHQGKDGFNLIWFSKAANPGTWVCFNWKIKYSFCWFETDSAVSIHDATAGQYQSADLNENNQITLTRQNDAYGFIKQETIGSGALTINTDQLVPANQAYTGIGIGDGNRGAVYVYRVLPNMQWTYLPENNSDYNIVFGDYKTGDIIEAPSALHGSKPLVFPNNVYALQVTLQKNNTWSDPVTPSAALLEWLRAGKRMSGNTNDIQTLI